MSEEWIEYMHRLDLDDLNNERKFYRHTVFIEGVKFSDDEYADESNSPLYKKYQEQFQAPEVSIDDLEHGSWVEYVDTPELVDWLKALKPKDIELLTYQIQDGLLPTDIAHLLNISDAAISKRRKRLKNELEKLLQKG